jgi:glutaredoxin
MRATIWSKEQCPHCVQAKNLLKLKGIDIEEKRIGDGFTREDLLAEVPTARSVPQIFLDGKLVGGLTELQNYLKENA